MASAKRKAPPKTKSASRARDTAPSKRSRPDADLLQWEQGGQDGEVSSDADEAEGAAARYGQDSDGDVSEEEREAAETAEEKRLRLARDYLLRLGEEEIADGSSGDDDESEGEDGVVNQVDKCVPSWANRAL